MLGNYYSLRKMDRRASEGLTIYLATAASSCANRWASDIRMMHRGVIQTERCLSGALELASILGSAALTSGAGSRLLVFISLLSLIAVKR